MSVNNISIEQLNAACRHYFELRELGATENLAIRAVELFSNNYAKFQAMGNTTPDRADEYSLWSVKALEAKKKNLGAKFGTYVRVEHGTPRRQFARLVLELHKQDRLNESNLSALCKKYWRIAVISLEEDRHLSKVARSKLFDSPEERWAFAGIEFPNHK